MNDPMDPAETDCVAGVVGLEVRRETGRLVFLVIEQDIENAVGHERDTDHCDEQRDVFGEQASAGLYDGSFGRRLLRRVSTSGPWSFRGTQILGEIENAHGEHGIKRWPTLSPLAARQRSLIRSPRRRARSLLAAPSGRASSQS
jgi:hypothetical protein